VGGSGGGGWLAQWTWAGRPGAWGGGEPLFAGLDLPALGYEVVDSEAGERATHFFLRKRA